MGTEGEVPLGGAPPAPVPAGPVGREPAPVGTVTMVVGATVPTVPTGLVPAAVAEVLLETVQMGEWVDVGAAEV